MSVEEKDIYIAHHEALQINEEIDDLIYVIKDSRNRKNVLWTSLEDRLMELDVHIIKSTNKIKELKGGK